MAGVDAARAGAVLTVDLDAVRELAPAARHGRRSRPCAAVMKADAYGLGMETVAPALALEGCRVFFTAHLEEGMRLRQLVPADSRIYVLHGPPPGATAEFVQYDLIPVLNDPAQIEDWRRACRVPPAPPAGRAAVRYRHVAHGPGPRRRGGAAAPIQAWKDESPGAGDEPPGLRRRARASMNRVQRERFAQLRARFAGIPGSLANSSAVFLGAAIITTWCGRARRCTASIRSRARPNPLRQAVSLRARIVQSRSVQAGDIVGYGARYVADGRAASPPSRSAMRMAGCARCPAAGRPSSTACAVPFAGTVSMDSITLDVTGIPEARVQPGQEVDLLCAQQTVDDVAREAGTIGYEVLTRLGSRFHRRYTTSFPRKRDPSRE
jgi:alanine racemase